MAIDGINISLKSIESIKGLGNTNNVKTEGTKKNGSFADMFSEAMKDVDQMQNQADKQIEGLVLGKDGVTTHDAMIALEKADVAFQLMNSIRTKIVRAYEEVMRTQV